MLDERHLSSASSVSSSSSKTTYAQRIVSYLPLPAPPFPCPPPAENRMHVFVLVKSVTARWHRLRTRARVFGKKRLPWWAWTPPAPSSGSLRGSDNHRARVRVKAHPLLFSTILPLPSPDQPPTSLLHQWPDLRGRPQEVNPRRGNIFESTFPSPPNFPLSFPLSADFV